MVYNMINGYPYFSYTLNSILMILMIAVPILTMRSMSDEHRARTDQLLLTSPVSVWGIVMGKFLSMVTILAVPMAIACLCPLIIRSAGTAYLTEDYASILAFFLLGCVYIAIGLFISSLTESQLIAAAGTFGILLLSILWPGLLNFIPAAASGSLGRFPYPVDPGVFYHIPADRPYPPFPRTGSSRSGSPYRNLFRKAEHV